MPRFIDLSVSIDNNEHSDHPGGSPQVTYRNHVIRIPRGVEHWMGNGAPQAY